MTDIIKDYMKEYEEVLRPLIFFVITSAIFIIATIHTYKMKRSKLDEMANLALNSDDE